MKSKWESQKSPRVKCLHGQHHHYFWEHQGMSNILWNMYRADLQRENDNVAYAGIDVVRIVLELHDGLIQINFWPWTKKTRRTLPSAPTLTEMRLALTAQAAESRVTMAKERIFLIIFCEPSRECRLPVMEMWKRNILDFYGFCKISDVSMAIARGLDDTWSM